ncbi:MAG: NUDIX hydrolase YfcD [Pseudomonadota bacterium]
MKANDPGDELIVVVDEENSIVGSATRRRMRLENLIHRATFILLFNGRGELFVQKRTQNKDVYPGYYEVVSGGVVGFEESYDEAAQRELEEELGIIGKPLEPLFDFFWQDKGNRVWGRTFVCRADGPVVLQEEEVEWGEFMPLEKVMEMVKKNPFTPDGLYALDRYLAQG